MRCENYVCIQRKVDSNVPSVSQLEDEMTLICLQEHGNVCEIRDQEAQALELRKP